ncbi:MAG: hypothetical protein V7709_05820 [Halioglobus sp.]
MSDVSQTTVIQYVLGRLKEEGVNDIFGVPGDYGYPVLDGILADPSSPALAGAFVNLPEGLDFISQALAASIGFGTPAGWVQRSRPPNVVW